MLKRRQEIYEELYPEAKAEEKRKIGLKNQNPRADTVSARETESFSADTAKKTGLSDRMIRQDLQLSKNLDSGGVNGVFGFIGLIKPFPKKLRKIFFLSHFFFFIPVF